MSVSVIYPSTERGSILIIVVAVVMIVSVALTFGLSKLKTQDNFERSLETQRKMERIYIELANYVHQNNRLPCPYYPYMIEEGGSGTGALRRFANMTNRFSGTETLHTDGEAGKCAENAGMMGLILFGSPWRGILPFRTLNLNEEDVKDAWGRFFVYGITDVYTRTYFVRDSTFDTMGLGPNSTNPATGPQGGRGTTPATAAQSNQVMSACRTDGVTAGISSANRWVINARDDGGAPAVTVNLNPQKALFCCPGRLRSGASNDLFMVTDDAAPFPEIDPSPYNWGAINIGVDRHVRHENIGASPAENTIFDSVTVPGGDAVFQRIRSGVSTSNCPGGGCSTEGWAFFISSPGPDGIPQSTRGWPYGTVNYGGGGWSPNRVLISNRYTGTHGTAADVYDDLVLYKTNFELMNKLNSATCQTPFYSYQR